MGLRVSEYSSSYPNLTEAAFEARVTITRTEIKIHGESMQSLTTQSWAPHLHIISRAEFKTAEDARAALGNALLALATALLGDSTSVA